MDGPVVPRDVDEYLDVLGQQPSLRIFTQLSFCFPVADASSRSSIINTLTAGLKRLSTSFPWLAGQVINEGAGEGKTGTFKIKPLEDIPRLVIKDLRDDPLAPTMDDLRQSNFPFSMLDESVIAPRKTLPSETPVEVFLLQANFITGGLILTFVAQHNTMDMTGQGQVIRLFSKACHGETFTSDELTSGNLPRSNLIPFLDESYEPDPKLDDQIRRFPPSNSISNSDDNHPPPGPSSKCTWAYFTFDRDSLDALKSLATKTITLPSGFISTDDALTAFIWQSIMRARLPRLDPNVEAKLARAVDVRRYLDVPQTYTGVLQNMTYHSYTLHKLIDEPLGSIASQLRLAVDPQTSDLRYRTCALATLMNRLQDKSITSFTASLELSVDIMLSSWSKVDCCDLDFNLGLGKPEVVRRPRLDPVESLIYLMPKAQNGEIAVGICLRDEDMERLRMDEEFAKYGKYVG
jgi:hypothetical protein